MAPLLFHISLYDLPSITSTKYAYTNDLAILYSSGDCKVLERTLLYSSGDWKVLERNSFEDMTTLSAYLQTW